MNSLISKKISIKIYWALISMKAFNQDNFNFKKASFKTLPSFYIFIYMTKYENQKINQCRLEDHDHYPTKRFKSNNPLR